MLNPIGSIGRRRYGKIRDGNLDPLIALLDQHDRNIVLDRVLAIAAGFLAYQPGIVY
jgi:hypothetical protein